jgi:hypothetical protein
LGLGRRSLAPPPDGFRHPKEAGFNRMLIVTLHCSDPACDAEVEMEVAELSELDGWPCDCGCGLIPTSIAEVIPLSRRDWRVIAGQRQESRQAARNRGGRI